MVIGASQRVGRAVALELARAGFDLVATFHNDHVGANETCSMAVALGAKVTLLKLDLGDTDATLQTARSLALDTLDALIVSAGLWEKDVAHDHAGAQAAINAVGRRVCDGVRRHPCGLSSNERVHALLG